MAAWNTERTPAYDDVRSFARDCRKVYRSLTELDLAWRGPGKRARNGKQPRRVQ